MSDKISQRKKTIFKMVLLFHACILLFVIYQNNWFGMITPSVREKPKLQEKEIENKMKISETKVKDKVKKQMKAVNKIYLPRQNVSEKQIEKHDDQIDVKQERPIERKEYLAFKEQSLPGRNAGKKEKEVPEILTVQPEVKPENSARNNVEKSISKQKLPPAKNETLKKKVETEKRFDFTDYTTNLISNYRVREGEKVPVLFIDDHNKSGLYKEGLAFYGYQLIAKPEVKSGKPYYFVINNSGMERIDEAWPYGNCPPALQEDRDLFRKLLSQPQFAEMTNRQYELFYAPVDTRMMTILECKLKLIIEEVRLATNEISRMTGTFKEIGDSYILIIESIVTAKGEHIDIDDPDNRITTAGRY
ncbi:MAG: hypothetical protein SCABRO_03782 [Candidatus Scalindua brodae]|uniref:Uncharacterized protein n=1 Tax=Candidatus Scalindua brodae TaxID=237368 RepID=A0A0B0EIE4_9BACT|nr:MAG: hypothetical protein SCABRO_03782 [Candidatus Scalindua brodae]